MKLLITILLLSLVVWNASADEVKPDIITVMPGEVYTPIGFDNNDNVQFVLEGTFPSTCYKVGPTSVKKDLSTNSIYVENKVHYYSDQYCLTMLVSYKKVVHLGIMNVGDFKIIFKSKNNVKNFGSLNVKKSNSKAADDYLYAPVDHVIYKKGEFSDENFIVIRGGFTNTCMKIKEIKMTRRANSNVLTVLPIAELEERSDCAIPIIPIPFEKKVSLDGAGKGRVLIHVRSLNGEAVNEIAEL